MEEQENMLQSRTVTSTTAETPQPPAFEPAGGQDASGDTKPKRPKWLVPVAAGCAVALIAAGGIGWYEWDSHQRLEAAKSSCADSVALVKKNRTAWEKLLASDDTAAALEITDKQVADAATVTALADAAMASSGKVAQCDATDTAGLTATADANGRTADAYAKASKTLAAAVDAVVESRDAKTLADVQAALKKKLDEARKLLSDSDGKVQDNATRDALSKAVDAADKGAKGDDAAKLGELKSALESAMKSVNDSVAAKTKADEEAAAQAAAEAAAAAAAQAQASQSWTPSYSTSGGSGSWSGGSTSGGSTGGGLSSGGSSSGGWTFIEEGTLGGSGSFEGLDPNATCPQDVCGV